MSTPTDQELVQYIGQGRREALAQLFDRYSADLYDYLARLVGDRDQAARLLDQVMLRVPGAAAGFQPRDSVRGWLYSLSREAGLDWLRQRGWLDGLPPSDEPIQPGLQGDVWKAARAMPGFFRAVLITEELQPLSPTEKARALGVNRTDLARLIEEARKSFNRIYDAQARAEGRPTSDRINTDTVWNARRRLPIEGGSLFGFLPAIEFPESLKQQIRRHVVDATNPAPTSRTAADIAAGAALGAATIAAVSGDNKPPPTSTQPVVTAQPDPLPPRKPLPPPTPVEAKSNSAFGGLPTSALAALLGVALALLLCGAVFLLTQNRSKPVVTATQPQNGQTVVEGEAINVYAVYEGPSQLDRTRTTMEIDGQPVVPVFINNTVAWTGTLSPGSHIVKVVLVDQAGNSSEVSWTFFVVAAGTGTPGATPDGTASVTPIAPVESVTPIAPVTSDIVTVTPIVVVGTPTSSFFTITPPPPTFAFPTFPPPPTFAFPTFPPPPPNTPCNRGGLSGLAYNDLNGNGIREPNEPGLSGVVINLQTQTNSVIGVTSTDAFGNYRFTDIPFGSYRVVANVPPAWFATTATTIPVFIGGCGVVPGFNFGFGQAPPPITATFTPTPTFGPSFAVVNVDTFVSPVASNTCPQTFTFNGSIQTNGAGSVTYRWERSDGTFGAIQSLPFAFAGTQNVIPHTWNLNFTTNGWARLQIISPSAPPSPLANFSLNCGPATLTPTATPTQTPIVPPFQVLSVNATVSPTSSTSCPQPFTFDGTITTNAPGNVTYQWTRNDGYVGPVQVLTFLVAGTQPVATEPYTIGEPGFIANGWGQIKVLTPNAMDSNQATFFLNCPPITLTPTFTPTATPLPASQVTNATADPAAPPILAACPGNVTFTGTITVDGPTNVTYEWEQSDGVIDGPYNLLFAGPGSQAVTPHVWAFGAGPLFLNNQWARINVSVPNAISSNQSTFDVACPF